MSNLSGNGPKHRLMFNGDENGYELWETKFIAHLYLKELGNIIDEDPPAASDAPGNAAAIQAYEVGNKKVYSELVLLLDDVSLSLIMRDAKDDGKKAVEILRGHYLGKSKPRIISLYSELASLQMLGEESVTDYVLRAEGSAAALRNAEENISDSLLIAMCLKGLPLKFNSFSTVITQKDEDVDFVKFKSALRSFEESQKSRMPSENGVDNVMKYNNAKDPVCYSCNKTGHKKYQCPEQSNFASRYDGRNNGGRKWCKKCRSATHNTDRCYSNKPRGDRNAGAANKTSANVNIDEDGQHSFTFKFEHGSLHPDENEGKDENCYSFMECMVVDSGATAHLCCKKESFISFDQSFNPETHYIELADGTRCNNVVKGRGNASVKATDINGVSHKILLENALYVPSYNQNIFSVESATNSGASVHFSKNNPYLKTHDGTVFDIEKRGKLYYINNVRAKTITRKSLEEWHNIYAHTNVRDIVMTEKCVNGMVITDKKTAANFQCDTCIKGKMTQHIDKGPERRATRPLQFVSTDLAGPINPVGREGFRYVIMFTCNYSGCIFSYLLKHKSDAVNAFRKFIADVAPYGKIEILRSDSGGEFLGSFKELAIQHAIKQEFSCAYSSHQNGRAERQWRTHFNLVRCIMAQNNVPKFLWTYALKYSVYVKNRCYNSRIGKTPFEIMTGICPNINKLEVFGAKCFAYVQNKQKLDDRAKEGMFLGFDCSSPAYLVYFPQEHVVRKVRCVIFNQRTKMQFKSGNNNDEIYASDEDDFQFQYPQGKHTSNDDDDVLEESVYEDSVYAEGDAISDDSADPCSEQSGVDGLPDTSDPTANERRYPSRDRKPPQYMENYETYFSKDGNGSDSYSVDYCFKMSFVPKSYNEAIKSENAEQWCNAMDKEMTALTDNDAYDLTKLPPDRRCIGGRWVYAVKPGFDNQPKFKARYCAKGFAQQYDIDYKETFAPTCRMTSVRMLAHFSVQNGMTIHQADMSSAFLHAEVDQDLYVQQPRGYVRYDDSGKELVMKLKKSLYGLKQSSRNWNNCLNDFLLSENFKRSDSDACFYSKFHNGSIIFILIHVDDLLISSSNKNDLISVKNAMAKRFKIKDLGLLKWYLGVEFKYSKNSISMSQENFIEKVLEKFNMQDAKTKSLPCDVGFNKFDCSESKPLENPTLFRAIIGSLVYILICSRPDISYVVTRLSQYMDKPKIAHLALAKDVLRYLKGTKSQALTFRKSNKPLQLHGYCDSDYAGSDDRKSTSGYCFKLSENSALISWKTKKQDVVSLSSCEAEYNAICYAVQEGKFLRQMFAEMQNLPVAKFILYADNQGALKLSQNPVYQQRSKHIDVKYHFTRHEIQNGTLSLVYIQTAYNMADMFTKALPKVKFQKFDFCG